MSATTSQLAALKWLIARNGDGLFEKNRQVLERAPIMRATWNALEGLGYAEIYQDGRRVRVTAAGRAVKLHHIEESA